MSLLGQDTLDPSLPGNGQGVTYTNWEATALAGCNCFDGYMGNSCEQGAPGALDSW